MAKKESIQKKTKSKTTKKPAKAVKKAKAVNKPVKTTGLTRDTAIKAIKTVEDPELGIDLWTLGLVYEIKIVGKNIFILMTLTSPTCPYAPMLISMMKQALVDAGFKNPEIDFTFDPPWEPSEEVKMMMGLA